MEFNREQHKLNMSKATDKLVADLSKIGIDLISPTLSVGNVTFKKGDKVIYMSDHSFYRYSGIMQITRVKLDTSGKETNWTEVLPVTDNTYLQQFIKPIIIKLLSL